MDTKRLIIAIALSIVVITVYQYFFMPKPTEPVPRPPAETAGQVTTGTEQDAGPQTQTGAEQKSDKRNLADLFSKKKKEVVEENVIEAVEEDLKETALKEVVVETDLYTAVFTNEGAGLKSFILKKYLDDKKQPDQ